jgi:hypothetical protein
LVNNANYFSDPPHPLAVSAAPVSKKRKPQPEPEHTSQKVQALVSPSADLPSPLSQSRALSKELNRRLTSTPPPYCFRPIDPALPTLPTASLLAPEVELELLTKCQALHGQAKKLVNLLLPFREQIDRNPRFDYFFVRNIAHMNYFQAAAKTARRGYKLPNLSSHSKLHTWLVNAECFLEKFASNEEDGKFPTKEQFEEAYEEACPSAWDSFYSGWNRLYSNTDVSSSAVFPLPSLTIEELLE